MTVQNAEAYSGAVDRHPHTPCIANVYNVVFTAALGTKGLGMTYCGSESLRRRSDNVATRSVSCAATFLFSAASEV